MTGELRRDYNWWLTATNCARAWPSARRDVAGKRPVNAESRRGGCLGSGASRLPAREPYPLRANRIPLHDGFANSSSGKTFGRLASFGDATSHEDAEGVRFGGELAIEAPRAREHPNIRETRGNGEETSAEQEVGEHQDTSTGGSQAATCPSSPFGWAMSTATGEAQRRRTRRRAAEDERDALYHAEMADCLSAVGDN